MSSQEDVFLSGEADAWFKRNRHVLDPSREDDIVRRVIEQAGLSPKKVLEVGCSNGYRLEAIRRATGCRASGVEPSDAAIAEGRQRFPEVEFRRGTLQDLPVPAGETFDLVICNFVLHWVSRAALQGSLAQIDRCVANEGCLIVGDFLPDSPMRVPYHHLPGQGVYTFKQDYAALLTATNLYREIVRFVYDHRTHRVSADVASGDRCSVVLLKRSETGFYNEAKSA
jgi:SAM-dependent methyltransferase